VRAKTSATAARLQRDAKGRRDLERLAREYLDRAARLLQAPEPSVVAVGGLSGSGKSTLALALAPTLGPVPGAVVIRTDEVRKRLCGVSPLAHLGPEGYAPDVSRRVYAAALDQAARVARAGHAVIVDAVFARPADREALAHAAGALGVPFAGLWLDAPPAVLMDRAARRTGDVSDADRAVVRAQVEQDPGPIAWRRIAAERSPDAVLAAAASALARFLQPECGVTDA
jgi:hypothetical protein